MRIITRILAVSLLLYPVSLTLQAGEDHPAPFLKPGNDYILSFAGKSPFKKTEGIPIDFNDKNNQKSTRITSASVTYSINVFTVVELYSDSWVYVEHPKSIKDAFKWNFKRYAMAALTPKTIAVLEATEEGKKQLAKLRKQAAAEIETDRTWVNIDHVVAITKPPTEPQDFKLYMKVEQPD